MGDRCWLRIEIHDEIKTIEDFEAVVKAVSAEFFGVSENDVIQELQNPSDNSIPTFEEDEVNYANIDDLEAVLRKHRISFHVYHGAGGDYGSGCRTYDGRDDTYWGCDNVHDGDPAILLRKLEEILKADDPLPAIKEIVTATARAAGDGLPSFSLSEKVKGWLIIGGPDLPKVQP